MPLGKRDGIVRRAAGADDLEARALRERPRDTVAIERVVVGDQHAKAVSHRGAPRSARSSWRSAHLRPPGSQSRNSPPRLSTLSRSPDSPSPSGREWVPVNPGPSSSTASEEHAFADLGANARRAYPGMAVGVVQALLNEAVDADPKRPRQLVGGEIALEIERDGRLGSLPVRRDGAGRAARTGSCRRFRAERGRGRCERRSRSASAQRAADPLDLIAPPVGHLPRPRCFRRAAPRSQQAAQGRHGALR